MALQEVETPAGDVPKGVRVGIVLCALVLLGLLSPFIETQLGMMKFRFQLGPGTSVAELHAIAGKPAKILQRGEPLGAARRSYQLPDLDEHTAIHFYPKDGVPYYNIYVFVDERDHRVLRVDIENLWW